MLFRSLQGRKPADVVEGIYRRLDEWTGGKPPQDDRTVLVVSYPAPA